MNGKFNIVFGFLYFAFTAVLGPTMLVPGKGETSRKLAAAGKVVEEVRAGNDKSIAPSVVAVMDYLKAERSLGFVSGAAHAHGNLEALLNIVAGMVLLTLSIPAAYKTLLSLLFIIGALMHSGLLYLAAVFGIIWVAGFTIIGAIAIVAGLILMAGAAVAGIKTKQ